MVNIFLGPLLLYLLLNVPNHLESELYHSVFHYQGRGWSTTPGPLHCKGLLYVEYEYCFASTPQNTQTIHFTLYNGTSQV